MKTTSTTSMTEGATTSKMVIVRVSNNKRWRRDDDEQEDIVSQFGLRMSLAQVPGGGPVNIWKQKTANWMHSYRKILLLILFLTIWVRIVVFAVLRYFYYQTEWNEMAWTSMKKSIPLHSHRLKDIVQIWILKKLRISNFPKQFSKVYYFYFIHLKTLNKL